MLRQRLLVLYAATSSPESDVGAWSIFDGTGRAARMSGDTDKPPFPSVLAAMKEGWRVIQFPMLAAAPPGHEHETAPAFEYVLEKLVQV